MNKLISNSEMVTFKGVGHTSPLEDPEQVTDALMRFVKKHLERA